MIKTTLKIDGMMCGMCEAHICDSIRSSFDVKKITASHSNGEAVILSDIPITEKMLREAIELTGYKVISAQSEPFEKKRFSLFGRK